VSRGSGSPLVSGVLDDRSRVRLHPLVVRREDAEFLVGRIGSGEFVAVPELGAVAIAELVPDRTLADVRARVEHVAGCPVEVTGFVNTLVELGFVAAVDDRQLPQPDEPVPSLPRVRPQHVRWLVDRRVGVAVIALLVVALVAVLAEPGLAPTPGHFFWLDHPGISVAVNTAIFAVVAAYHELAHLLTARAFGLPGKITLTTRLHRLGAQTAIPSLWALPRRQRSVVQAAGLAADLSLLSASILTAAAVPALEAPLGALGLVIALGMFIQLQLFMQTDLYFLAAELFKARNLFQDSAVQVVHSVRRTVSRRARALADPLAGIARRERRLITGYAVVMVIGTALALTAYALYGIPILVGMFVRGVASVRHGVATGDLFAVLDGSLVLAVETGLQLLFIRLFLRGRRARMAWLRARLG
jgi:putative peptide zinc metalloprotease protein